MLTYYLIYIPIILLCVFYKAPQKRQDDVIKIWILAITLFGGLRWKTGYDWDTYFALFRDLDWGNFLSYSKYGDLSLQTIEPLYAFLNVLVKSIFGKYYVFNLLVCFFIHYSYYRFAKYHIPQCPIICFCFVELVLVAFFPVRQTLATAVLLWGFRYIKEQKLFPYLVVVALAFCIHRMSIVALPLYWVGKVRLNDAVIIPLFFSFVVIGKLVQNYVIMLSLVLGGQLGELLNTYTETQSIERTGIPITTIFLNCIFLGLYLYFRKKFRLKNDKWYNFCLNSFILFFGIMAIFAQGMGDMTRLISVFLPGHCLLFSSILIYSLRRNPTVLMKSNSKVVANRDKLTDTVCMFTIVFAFAYILYKFATMFNDYYFEDACLPYRTIFDFSVLI